MGAHGKAALAGAALLLAVAGGCGGERPRAPPNAPAGTVAAIGYDVEVVSTEPWRLSVAMRIDGVATSLEVPAAARPFVTLLGGPTDASGERVPLDCLHGCRVRYEVNLSLAAELSGDDPAVAVASGGDLLAPASTWLLRPTPLSPRVPVGLSVRAPEGTRFASAFDRVGHGGPGERFSLRSEELAVAGFTAFGRFTALRVQATRGAVDVAVLRGERAAGDAMLERWVSAVALAQDGVFGRFPVERAQVFLVPHPGLDRVGFGRTLPAGGPSVAVRIGATAGERQLREDWVLAHELFHLGVPSFWNEGEWMEEGLATYLEPVLRARAGLLSAEALWGELARDMPRGLTDEPLARARGGDRIYWGGALFALRLDVIARARSGGQRTLDDGLRAVLARGGTARRVWPLARFVSVLDEAIGGSAAAELHLLALGQGRPGCAADREPAHLSTCAPERRAFEAILVALGIERTPGGEVRLRSDAPLASTRLGIERGARRAPVSPAALGIVSR